VVAGSPLLLRSLLFVPATRPDRFQKAFDSGADAVVIDLEDSVEPARKAEARRSAGEWLTTAPRPGPACFIRVNAPGFPWQDDDLEWLATVSTRVEAVVLPKAETASAIVDVADAAPGRRVVPLLETARGILHAGEILTARAEIPAVLFGAEDLTAELGIPRTVDGDELLYARSRVVLAAATIGADPIDAVWVHLAPPDALRADALRAKALGFRGKMAIHPDQVAIINQVFSPSADEVAAARRLVDADERARAAGDGVFRMDDSMVDAPVIKRARRVLELAARTADN
jgi:citrate lyase subunit beta/citryl-CoA lyase